MNNLICFFWAFLMAFCVSAMQPAVPQSVNKYLGQTPPGNTLRRFPPDNLQMLAVLGIWTWHGVPAFSPDCKEMFFAKYLHLQDRAELWQTRFINNQWTVPRLAPFGNQAVIENCPVFSQSGDTLFFYSERSGTGGFFQTIRQPGELWSEPQKLPLTLPSDFAISWNLSMTKNNTLYLDLYQSSTRGDIYRCPLVDGSYTQFERLPDQVNTFSHDGSAFIDPDEEYLLFCSDRSGGFGLYDIYISYRDRDGGWSQSVNLGSGINSSETEVFPSVTLDGKYMFLNTVRTASQDQGYNPYWVSAAFIDLMRPVEPDTGNRVVFFSDRDGNAEIYSMFPDGSDLKRLTNNLYTDMDPAWSNDGSQIVFASDRDGNFELFVMNADGSNTRKLTGTGFQAGTPDWSPDGTRILFTALEDTYSEEGGIGLVNSDGSGTQILTAAGQGYAPAWSGDGSEIIFCSQRTGYFEIYLMDSDGNNLKQITGSQTDKLNARLSPDGQQIVYSGDSPDGNGAEIHLVNMDGTGDVSLTRSGGLNVNPCWSSDGKQIYFQTNRFGNREIYQMDANGRNQVNITRNERNDNCPNLIRKASVTGISDRGILPVGTGIKNLWPNPAGHSAQIEFSVTSAGHVDIMLVDPLGREVMMLLDENRVEGIHLINFDITRLSSGIYTVVLITGRDISVQKFIKD